MGFNTLADYLNTVIYEIKCKDDKITDTYIGHTTCFKQRYRLHKNSCINPNQKGYHYKIYQNIRLHGGWDNWEMVGIEQFPCNNVNEAREREAYWIELLSSSLNIKIPNRKTTKEYKKIYRIIHREKIAENAKVYRKINCDKIQKYIHSHIEKIKDQKKEWYEKNKEKILEKAKLNYEEHKEEKLNYQKGYAEKHQEKIKEYLKEYHEKNKEQILVKQKVYREENKEEISHMQKEWKKKHSMELKEKNSQVIKCECGSEYTCKNQARHLNTQKHLLYETKDCVMVEENSIITKEEEQAEQIEANQTKTKKEVENGIKKNTDKIKETKKKYNESHKDKIQKQCKEYYVKNKEKILEQTKTYSQENKEKAKNYKDNWYQKNKEKILANQKETYLCDCGSTIRCSGRLEHLQSVKHKKYTENIVF